MNNALKIQNTAIEFPINANALRAGLQFTLPATSNEATRYYLGGVFFDKQAGRELVLVATDGHRLHRIVVNGVALDLEFSFIMPIASVKAIIKAVNSKINFEAVMTLNGADFEIMLDTGSVRGVAIDGKFPQYERVIPKHEERKILGNYQARYLVDTLAAFEKLGKYSVVSSWGDDDLNAPVVLKAENNTIDALAVIMPTRV